MKSLRGPICNVGNVVFVSLLGATAVANADVTLDYQTSGHDCRGDFERMRVKGPALRVDSNMGGREGSFVYDGIEKLAYALDHRQHQFVQLEVDEDAAEFNADRMASLQKMVRNQTGVDPFEQARALCPGIANADAKPGQPVNCAAAVGSQSSAQAGAPAPGAPASGRAASTPGMSAENMQAMQQLMQQQMAKMTPEQRERMQRGMAASGLAGYGAMAGAPALPESDRDLGPATVAGIACTRRQHLRGDEIVREECLTSLAGLKLAAADSARIARMAGVMARWRDSMMPGGAASRRGPAIDNVVVERVCYTGAAESGRATLRIAATPIADAEFVVPPPGYSQMGMGLPGEAAQR